PALNSAGVSGIERALSIAWNHTGQHHATGLRSSRSREPHGLEWNFKPHHITMAGDFRLGVPNCIEGAIHAAILSEQRVLLDAIRIAVENVCMALVIEGIQEHAYLIVIIDQFAAQHTGAYFLRLRIKSQKDDIK